MRRVTAHRLVLSAASAYFRAMFSTPMKESVEGEITLQSIKGPTLDELVRFCYSGMLRLTDKNVQELLEAAVEFQFHDVIQLCCEFMRDQLVVENCVGFYLFAMHFNLDYLTEHALDMICERFEQVASADEFEQMPVDTLKAILNMNALQIASEEIIFNAVKNWVMFEESRTAHLADLLKFVRYTQLDVEVRQQSGLCIVQYSLGKVPTIFNYVNLQTVQRFYKEMEDRDCGDVLKIVQQWTVKRVFVRKETVETTSRLMVIGGETKETPFSTIEYICPRFGKWKFWHNLPDARKDYAVVVFNNYLFIIGGQLDGECLDTVSSVPLILEWKMTTIYY